MNRVQTRVTTRVLVLQKLVFFVFSREKLMCIVANSSLCAAYNQQPTTMPMNVNRVRVKRNRNIPKTGTNTGTNISTSHPTRHTRKDAQCESMMRHRWGKWRANNRVRVESALSN